MSSFPTWAPRASKLGAFVQSKLFARDCGYPGTRYYLTIAYGEPQSSNFSLPSGVTAAGLILPFGGSLNYQLRLIWYNSSGAKTLDGESGATFSFTSGTTWRCKRRLAGTDGVVSWSEYISKQRWIGPISGDFKYYHAPIDRTGAAGVLPTEEWTAASPFWTLDSTESVTIASSFDFEDRYPNTPASASELTALVFVVA